MTYGRVRVKSYLAEDSKGRKTERSEKKIMTTV